MFPRMVPKFSDCGVTKNHETSIGQATLSNLPNILKRVDERNNVAAINPRSLKAHVKRTVLAQSNNMSLVSSFRPPHSLCYESV